MSLFRLCTRVSRLEARRPPVANAFNAPTLSEAFIAEVWCIVWATGPFRSVEVMLKQCVGLSDEASIAAVSFLLTGDTC